MKNYKLLLLVFFSQFIIYSCQQTKDDQFPDWAIGPFTRYENNPILTPEGDGWESENAYNPAVIKKDNKFYMLYRGEDKDTSLFKNYRSQIGLAISDDGINWERYPDNPVIKAEYDYELPGGVEDPRLVKKDGVFYAYYTAYNPNDRPFQTKLCVATSTDMVQWEKHGPITDLRMKNAAVVMDSANSPVKINGEFIMYSSVGSEPYISYSDDLIHWDFKELKIEFPESFKPWEFCISITNYDREKKNIIVFLGGRLNGDLEGNDWHYALGQALFSKDNPEELKDYLKEPFMIPKEPYELKGNITHTLFFETIMKHDDKWWIWYGGADHVTCLATAPAKH